ncbi:MFS transporter [Sphingomonas silueang]|uniref:MFS transporter n=1 Tax=Sphingomonas silueang TaxID=3156617 RepID=UPI0032B468FD
MSAPDFSLLAKRRYGPLFVVQFLGAMNDNLLKFALLFLANFTLYRADPTRAASLATIATGLFILPYFLFSGLAGQLADARDKALLMRWVKGAEIAIMAVAVAGFHFRSVEVLLGCLFAMGMHSCVFGPAKYAILPQHLHGHELMGGTGLVEAGTFVAILVGQLLGGVVAPLTGGVMALGFAVAGFAASLAIPPAPPAAPGLRIDFNPLRSTAAILRAAHGPRGIWVAILGISWFFAVGAVVLSQFAPLVSGTLHAGPGLVTLFLALFSLCVAAGSLLVNRLLKGEVSARTVPLSTAGLGLCLIDLWWTTSHHAPVAANVGVAAFAADPRNWHLLAGLGGIALFGGMFVVPLYAILQTRSPPDKRSQVIAANNIVNGLVTVMLVVAVGAILGTGMGIPATFALMGVATLPVAWVLDRLNAPG